MAKALIGEYRKDKGVIVFNGREIRKPLGQGVRGERHRVPERGSKKEGLFLKHSLQANISIASLGKMLLGFLLDPRKVRKAAVESIERLRIKAPGPGARVETLSGGNQQKAIIAKWLLTGAQVFIFDEPTRGIDVGAKAEIYALMEELLRKGASIIMISSEMLEVLRMADRILVMRDGCGQVVLDNDGLKQEDVLQYAIGANVYHVCTE